MRGGEQLEIGAVVTAQVPEKDQTAQMCLVYLL